MTLSSFYDALSVQYTTISALIVRESRARFGESSLGYFWAVFLPIGWISTFYILFLVANRSVPFQEGIVPFIASGIVPYHAFHKVQHFVSKAIRGNKVLFYFSCVRPLDVFLARALLDCGTYIAIFFIIIGGDILWFADYGLIEPSRYSARTYACRVLWYSCWNVYWRGLCFFNICGVCIVFSHASSFLYFRYYFFCRPIYPIVCSILYNTIH